MKNKINLSNRFILRILFLHFIVLFLCMATVKVKMVQCNLSVVHALESVSALLINAHDKQELQQNFSQFVEQFNIIYKTVEKAKREANQMMLVTQVILIIGTIILTIYTEALRPRT